MKSKISIHSQISLKKKDEIIKFNQKTCLKSYIYMNKELRNKTKHDFGKHFSKLMNNSIF